MRLERNEEAIAELRKGVAIHAAVFGPDHLLLYVEYNNIGVAYTLLGRYDEAREAIARGLVLAKPLGEKSATQIVLLASMAVVDNRAGRSDVALEDVEKAMAIVRETGDNGARFLPCLYEQRGRALLAKHDWAGAAAECARGVKIQEEQEAISPELVYTDDPLTCLGEAELASGKVDDALLHLERSVSLTKRDWSLALPLADLALAKALRAAGRDPARARALAASALAALLGRARRRGAGARGRGVRGEIAHTKERPKTRRVDGRSGSAHAFEAAHAVHRSIASVK